MNFEPDQDCYEVQQDDFPSFSHFYVDCKTHHGACKMKHSDLYLIETKNKRFILYYRPSAPMTLTQARRAFAKSGSHDLSISGIEDPDETPQRQVVEYRGSILTTGKLQKGDERQADSESRCRRDKRLESSCDKSKRKIVEDRSTSRSRSKSKPALRVKPSKERRKKVDQPVKEEKTREIDYSSFREYMEEMNKNIEMKFMQLNRKVESLDKKAEINQEEIEVCKTEIENHHESFKHCYKKLEEHAQFMSDTRKDINNLRAQAMRREEELLEVRRKADASSVRMLGRRTENETQSTPYQSNRTGNPPRTTDAFDYFGIFQDSDR